MPVDRSGHRPRADLRWHAQGGAAGAVKQLERRLWERVRCPSLVDWPVYPRLRRTMRASSRSRKPRATTVMGLARLSAISSGPIGQERGQ